MQRNYVLTIACSAILLVFLIIVKINYMSSSQKKSSQNKIVYQEFGTSQNVNNSESNISDLAPKQQNLKIQTSKAGRKGKTVTIISGFQCNSESLTKLLKQLKTKCGTGGTLKENTIELQGDLKEKLLGILTDLGYKVK